MATALPRTLGELQLYRILQKANLLIYFDAFIQQGGDDVQQLCEAGEEEFLEIMALVGMASKPLHVRRLQKALRDWVTNPSLFNQPLTSLPVSSIPVYKLPEGSPAWLGISCNSYERNSNAREPHLKIPKCAATTCVQSVGATKSDGMGNLQLQSGSDQRLWQGHHTTESEHSLSPADVGSPASPKENAETLDAAAALSVSECVERLVPTLPKSDSNEVKELLRVNKKLAKMVGHIFEMSDEDPHKEEEIRKYSAIYGRFDSKRKDGKHLTLHELTVNEAAAQLCVKDNALLTRRDELFALARQISREVTYKYTYRTTKSKCGERDELSPKIIKTEAKKYRHKSGCQKRKERKQRYQEEEILRKKTIMKYVQPTSTQEDVEIGETSEAVKEVIPELREEETLSSISFSIDIIIEEDTTSSAVQSATDSEAVVDDPLVSESVASEAFEHEKTTGSNVSTDIIPSNIAYESPENADYSEMVDWKDPATWPDVIQRKERKRIVQSGLMMEEDLKQMAQSMATDVDGHSFSEFLLYAKSPNGRVKILRDWLRWSISRKVLYCITCFTFSNELGSRNTSFLCKKEGFDPTKNKWRRLYTRLPEHELSAQHRKHYWSWRTLQKTDAEKQITLARETDKFSLLVQRLLDVTLYLSSRNLPFRGCTQRIGDVKNGIFLGTLELLSRYDALLSDHLQKVKDSQEKGGRMPVHYLSWGIQNEFIDICGNRIVEAIITERKEAQYFAIICDATPDISHTEQNVIVIRYVHQDPLKGSWSVEEGFIEFFDFFKKTGEEIADMIITRLNFHRVDLSDCRGQGYDNGANMSGRIKGVQARIKEKYPQAMFCPCATHTLNLVGVHAASCCPEVKTFFGKVDRLYALCSSSPEQWKILTEEIGCSLHGLSDTRWSARIEAIRPIARRLPSILTALEKIIATGKLTTEAHSDAQGLYEYFSSFRAIFLTTFWVKVLTSFNQRNKILQSGSVSMDIAAANIKDLMAEMQSLRERWSSILSEATVVAENMNIPTELMNTQQLRQTRTHQESAQDSFRSRIFYLTLDTIISDLHHRFKSMEDSCKLFAPILKLRGLSEEDLITSSNALICAYPNDFTQSLVRELQFLRNVYKATFSDDLQPLDLLNAIYDLQLQEIFPEVCIALRIFSTLPLSVAEGERAFSKLTLIKNYLRSTMSQQRLNSLALLSIEQELAKKLDFKDLIKDFANRKVRRMAH